MSIGSHCTVSELKARLESSSQTGIVLDIDETLAATNVAWFQRCVELFGNPDGASVDELIAKYHLAQYNPAWQTKAAQDWMHRQRTAPEAQDGLPVIDGAVKGVQELLACNSTVSVVAYLTVRPESVNNNTIHWLKENGFPDLPVVAKPETVTFEEGNRWKAQSLHQLWPQVIGIVDDNPKVPIFAGPEYHGIMFLFGRDHVEPDYSHAIPCKTWSDVVMNVKEGQAAQKLKELQKHHSM